MGGPQLFSLPFGQVAGRIDKGAHQVQAKIRGEVSGRPDQKVWEPPADAGHDRPVRPALPRQASTLPRRAAAVFAAAQPERRSWASDYLPGLLAASAGSVA